MWQACVPYCAGARVCYLALFTWTASALRSQGGARGACFYLAGACEPPSGREKQHERSSLVFVPMALAKCGCAICYLSAKDAWVRCCGRQMTWMGQRKDCRQPGYNTERVDAC